MTEICAICDTEIVGERVTAPAISRGEWACAECASGERKSVLRAWILAFGEDLTLGEAERLSR